MRHDTNLTSKPRGKAGNAHAAFADLMIEATQRGYYGTVALTLHVQDGFIQQVRVATERVVK